jgi:hypothetical protein
MNKPIDWCQTIYIVVDNEVEDIKLKKLTLIQKIKKLLKGKK